MPEKKIKLLVADDHKLFIEGLRYVLKNELQIEVTDFALNGKEAIEKCRILDIDAVIMDINMPVIDGLQATEQIKQLFPSIKIIVVSTANDYTTVTKAIKSGADGYVLKDAGSEELIKALRTVFKNELFISAALAHFFANEKEKTRSRNEYIKFSENLITPREHSVLKLIAEGFTNQQIADTLFLSVKTVDTHRKNMLAKLKLPNTAALVKFAFENKLL